MSAVFREFPLAAPLPEQEIIPPHMRSVFNIPPGGTIRKNFVMAKLTNPQITELRNSTSAIYVYGIITYTDVFGVERMTRYSFRHNGLTGVIGRIGELTGIERGNDAT